MGYLRLDYRSGCKSRGVVFYCDIFYTCELCCVYTYGDGILSVNFIDIVWFLKVCTNFYSRRILLVIPGVPIKAEVITRYMIQDMAL